MHARRHSKEATRSVRRAARNRPDDSSTARARRRARLKAERPRADFVHRTAGRVAAARRSGRDGRTALATRDALTLAHAGFVRRVAHRIGRRLPPHVDRADLVSVGMIGLLDAAARYRPSTGVPFEAFARPRVSGAIMDSLRDMDWVPRSVRALERKAGAAASILRQQLGREPSRDEIASRLGVAAETPALGAAMQEAMPGEPMQEGVGTIEQCPDPSESVEAKVLRAELTGHLRREVQRLPGREQRILDGYYQHELTMGEIGANIGVCESRVSQLRTAAIAQLRRTLVSAVAPAPSPAWTPVVLTGRANRPGVSREALAGSAGGMETPACRAA